MAFHRVSGAGSLCSLSQAFKWTLLKTLLKHLLGSGWRFAAGGLTGSASPTVNPLERKESRDRQGPPRLCCQGLA